MKFRLLKNLPALQEGTILTSFGDCYGSTLCKREGSDEIFRFPWDTQDIWIEPIKEVMIDS